MSGLEKPTDALQPAQGVSCAKCGHLNPRGHSQCHACGAHLHVVCHYCGHRNARVEARCSECGHKLHRSWFRRFENRVLGKRKKVTWLQLGLLLLGILVGAALIYFLAEFKMPEPESFYAPLFSTHRLSHA